MSELIRRSRQQEKRASFVTRGKVQPRSGAGWVHKGDVRSDRFLVECKRTDQESFRVTKDLMGSVDIDARSVGKLPVLHVEIGYGKSSSRYWVLPDWAWAELLLALGEEP